MTSDERDRITDEAMRGMVRSYDHAILNNDTQLEGAMPICDPRANNNNMTNQFKGGDKVRLKDYSSDRNHRNEVALIRSMDSTMALVKWNNGEESYPLLSNLIPANNNNTTPSQSIQDEINTITQTFEAKLITKEQKNRYVTQKQIKQYMGWFRNGFGRTLEKLDIVLPSSFNIGDFVRTNSKYSGETLFGMILEKTVGTAKLLIFKQGRVNVRNGYTNDLKYELLKKIPNPINKYKGKGVLFPQKKITNIIKDIKNMIEQIKDIKDIKSCVISTHEDKPCLKIITNDLKIRYGRKMYNLGQYDFIIIIEKDGFKYKKSVHGLPQNIYTLAKRKKGSIYMPDNSCDYAHPFINPTNIPGYRDICFGDTLNIILELLLQHNYYAVVEYFLSTLYSDSINGYGHWWFFLPALELGLTENNYKRKLKEFKPLNHLGSGHCANCGNEAIKCACGETYYKEKGIIIKENHGREDS